jgi:alpha-glucosidase
MSNRLICSVLALVFAWGLQAGEYVNGIEALRGEKWWGDSTVMVSSMGRYVYGAGAEPVKAGKTLREAFIVCALKNLGPGRSPDPRMFTLPVYETALELGFTQGESEVVGYAEKLLAEGFPPGIMVIAEGWQKVSGPYEFDPELYPDPKRMVDRLHESGFRVMLTISAGVPRWGSVFGTALRDGQLLPLSHMLDMGNDVQFERLRTGFEKIKAECGFDGFRFDWRPYSPSGKFVENMLSLGEGGGMIQYCRLTEQPYAPYLSSTGAGSSPAMVENIVMAGLRGYPYVQTEAMQGYIRETTRAGERDMADYLLMQCGMPVVSVDFAPWRITDPVLYAAVREAMNIRAAMGDYVARLVADSRRTGEPLVRHMEYQFPGNGFADCTDQFMLGPQYLFAPCVDGGDKRTVRFPRGTWVGRSGERIKGPVVRQLDCSAGELPCFELVSSGPLSGVFTAVKTLVNGKNTIN